MKKILFLLGFLFFLVFLPVPASATHSWGGYHWARTTNPFTLRLGDNVSSAWDPYLTTTSSDWSVPEVLDTSIVAGGSGSNCRPTAGRVEVCDRKYGNNGWLGLAQIWVSGFHITQATAKMNDTYFNTRTYNNPGWKNMVMCQEVGHTLGLDHQDEIFDNPNLGTCMDYTNNPYGPLDNEHPNAHDYEELGIIYTHLDTFTTVGQKLSRTAASVATEKVDDQSDWGRQIAGNNRVAHFERDFGGGNKLYTFVIWAR